MLLVAGAGTLDPGVPGSLQLMTASWLRGTLEPGMETVHGPGFWMQSQLLKQYLLILLQVSVSEGESEHVFCHL